MGITGLIPFLEKASKKTNVRELQHSTVAIDSYCWLHKGAFAVADKLARGEDTDVHIHYCLKYVNMLLDNNIKPILVFDGRHLPAKAETEAKRREQRKNAKQRAAELIRLGKMDEARTFLRRCVDITHDMALKLIKACRNMNVDCIVAPYEADGQLAYLSLQSIADYVITEDSDLVLFGCKRILFKLDLTGACLLIESDKLHLTMGCREDKFTFEKFRNMCILSGCDYLDSLPGIGLAKACKFVNKTEETDMMRALDKIPAYLNMRQLTVTDEYKINFMKANATFQHMVVYDPRTRRNVHLTDPEEVGTDMEYCTNAGVKLDDKTALHLAVGNLNPFTLKPMDNWHPDRREKSKGVKSTGWRKVRIAKHPSIWDATIDLNFHRKKTVAAHQPTLLNMVKRSHPPSKPNQDDSPQIEDSDDDADGITNSEELLSAYATVKSPPSKKFKDDYDSDDQTTSAAPTFTSPKRNPFKVSASSSSHLMELLSPTKITKQNSSLIRNQSPVKRIEYPNPSPVKRIDYKRLEKLSKFQRTIIPNKQNVLSRFFSNSTVTSATVKSEPKSTTTTMIKTEQLIELDESNKTDKATTVAVTISEQKDQFAIALDSFNRLCSKNNLEIDECYHGGADGERTPERDDVSLSGSTGTTANSQRSIYDDYDKTDQVDSGSSSLLEIIPDRPLIVIDDDDEDDVSGEGSEQDQLKAQTEACNAVSPSLLSKNLYVNKKRTCRRLGLSKGKQAANKTPTGAVQSRLSMFGFQKKPQVS